MHRPSKVTFSLVVLPALLGGPAALRAVSLVEVAGAVGPSEARAAVGGIVARAEAAGPRGAFGSEVVSLADGTVRFRLTRDGVASDRMVTAGSVYARSEPAAALGAAEPAVASFVRGHEVHRMLLDLERRFRDEGAPDDAGCLRATGPDGMPARLCVAATSGLPERIVLDLPEALGGGSVALELADWRPVAGGVRLPFAVDFVAGGERHTYRYVEVLPFRLAPGVPLPEDPDPLFARLGDLADLAAAHARVIDAHRRSDVEGILEDEAEASSVVNRGALLETRRDALRERLGGYLAATRFTRYEDVALPVVAVSRDGSLGWVACQIEAEGTQTGASGEATPIAYGFSWVELYSHATGRWLRIGNASSPKP